MCAVVKKRALAVIAGVLTLAVALGLGLQPATAQDLDEAARQAIEEASRLDQQARKLHQDERYAEAVPLYKRALEIAEKQFGSDHPAVAHVLNNLADTYVREGRYEEAEPLAKRSLEIREKALDPEDPELGISLSTLAEVYHKQQRFEEAEPLYKRSLEVFEKAWGPKDGYFVQSLVNLASLYEDQGRYSDAEPLRKRVLAIFERELGLEHPQVADALSWLANLYVLEARYSDAEPLLKRSLAIKEKAYGREHPEIVTSLQDLAANYSAQTRYSDAEPFLERSLAILEEAFGPEDPKVATSLYGLADVYKLQARYTDAEPLFKRSLAILEKAYGPDHLHVAVLLNGLASLYSAQARYADAEPLFQRSLAILEKAYGPDHLHVAVLLNGLASLYSAQARYADAESLYKRSLAILENAPRIENAILEVITATSRNLAQLYVKQMRYADAELLFKRAMDITEKVQGHDHPHVSYLLHDLATLYANQGRFADAGPQLKRALAITERAFGRDHPQVAASLTGIGNVHMYAGHYAEAEPLLKRALAIEQKVYGLEHPRVATSLQNLASLYQEQGRYAESEPLFKRAIEVEEKALGTDHPSVATTLDNLAQLYHAQHRFAAAELLLKRSLDITEKALGPNHITTVRSLNNLARIYLSQRRYAEAEPLFKRAFDIFDKSLADHPGFSTVLDNLAQVYHSQRRYTEAELLYKRSLEVAEKSLGLEHTRVAISLMNLSALYVDQGRYVESETLHKRGLGIFEEALGRNHPDVFQSLNNIVVFYKYQRRYADALPIIRRTIDQDEAPPDPTLGILIGARRKGLISDAQALIDSYKVLQVSTQTAAADAVKDLALRFASGSGELAQLVRKYQDLGVYAHRLDETLTTSLSGAPEKRNHEAEEALRKRLTEIDSEGRSVAQLLSEQFPDYVALASPAPLTLQETKDLLSDNEAVVAFLVPSFPADVVQKPKGFAWVVTKTSADFLEIPVNFSQLTLDIKKLRLSLTFAVDAPFDTALAYEVYKKTFEPLAEKLKGKTRISVVANGALTSIPFGLLVTSNPEGKSLKNLDWLIKSHAITVIPSIYSLKTMRAQVASTKAPKPMIAFADPVFSEKPSTTPETEQVAMRSLSKFYRGSQLDAGSLAESLPQLPGTRTEVETIADRLKVPKGDVKLGSDATETAVKRAELDAYKIIYFATHGLVAGELQEFAKAKVEPALALSFPEEPTDLDNGLLEASEVAQLKMNADWVVLSACNTASSDGVGAEPLSGLASAFLYAGGRSLIVSHWDVADEATAELMTNLFAISEEKPTLSHGEMMREAKLKLLDAATSDDEAHPRFWAPFVVVGEPAVSRTPSQRLGSTAP